jgi:hypothetical protein
LKSPTIVQFGAYQVPKSKHQTYTLWSYRHLYDAHAIFISEYVDNHSSSTCLLCGLVEGNYTPKKAFLDMLTEHAHTHHLRRCAQTIFTNPREFAGHLETEHNAIVPRFRDKGLTSWQVVHTLNAGVADYNQQTFRGDLCSSS